MFYNKIRIISIDAAIYISHVKTNSSHLPVFGESYTVWEDFHNLGHCHASENSTLANTWCPGLVMLPRHAGFLGMIHTSE